MLRTFSSCLLGLFLLQAAAAEIHPAQLSAQELLADLQEVVFCDCRRPKEKIYKLIERNFAIDEIGRKLIGTGVWDRLRERDRVEFAHAVITIITNSYYFTIQRTGRIESSSSKLIRKSEDLVVVGTTFSAGSKKSSIIYEFVPHEGEWRILNVKINSFSFLIEYRRITIPIIRKLGFPVLLAQLKDKAYGPGNWPRYEDLKNEF